MKRKKVITLLMLSGVLLFTGCQKTPTNEKEPVAKEVEQQAEEKSDASLPLESEAETEIVSEISDTESEVLSETNTQIASNAALSETSTQTASNAALSETNAQTASNAALSEASAESTALQNNASKNQQELSNTYVWQEITITIPSEWKDAVIIEEQENGVWFYQKSSYEKEKGMGFICGVEKSNEYYNYGAGESLIAYTDSGTFYYLICPTDVTCDPSDETVFQEYIRLMDGYEILTDTIKIDKNDIYYDPDQYELPASNIVKLHEGHLDNYSDNDLWIARNEIYARHGKIFKNQYLQNYFDSCSWYSAETGKENVSDNELSEIELYNLKLIIAAEEAYASEHPYPKQYPTGKEVSVSLTGDKKQQKISYSVKETAADVYSCQLKIDDTTYELGDYVTFITPVEDLFYITDICESSEELGWEDGLEIAVLDDGPSGDPVTYFFKYNGNLKYVGEMAGFPFKDYDGNPQNAGKQVVKNGFNNQNGIFGRGRIDLIETAYIDTYWWYDYEKQTIEKMDLTMYDFQWRTQHESYIDVPLYITMSDTAPTITMRAQKDVSFIKTDGKEWILIRAKDGTEGYIHVKDGKILNVNASAETVFSDLNFFD